MCFWLDSIFLLTFFKKSANINIEQNASSHAGLMTNLSIHSIPQVKALLGRHHPNSLNMENLLMSTEGPFITQLNLGCVMIMRAFLLLCNDEHDLSFKSSLIQASGCNFETPGKRLSQQVMEGNVEPHSTAITDAAVTFDGPWKLWGFNYHVMSKLAGVNSTTTGMHSSISTIHNIKPEKAFQLFSTESSDVLAFDWKVCIIFCKFLSHYGKTIPCHILDQCKSNKKFK